MKTSPEASSKLSHLSTGNVDQSINEEALEEQDQLPSLPSTSSSLFIASHYRSPQSKSQYGSSIRKKASLYGNPSIAASDAISIEGCSTFEYDINSNIHKQQVRRKRGGSNASISTVASALSRNASIAESMQSYNYASTSRHAYDGEDDRHSVIAHGQFISNQSATSSIRRGGGGGNVVGGDEGNNKSAAASLRKIGRASGIDAKFLDSLRQESAEEDDSPPGAAHLTDKLERLIANSASYRSANSRSQQQQQQQDSSFTQRQRKNSYASMRSLIGFTSSNQRQTGDYRAPPSRTASLFGMFIGSGESNQMNKNDTLRSPPVWSKSPTAMAPVLTSTTHSGMTSVPTSPTLTQSPRDAMGSLRGLRGLFDDPNFNGTTPRTRTMSAMSRPTVGTISKASSNAEGKRSERKRNVSFQPSTESRLNNIHTNTATSATHRRAFASIDPTSGVHASGTSTPHTAGSISPPLINSRADSQVDLASLTASATSSTSGAIQNSESGAMPALDSALARAEERSGLKTSSNCSSCGLKVVNAPMTKTGEVFCSRDCRILAKQKRKQAAATATTTTTTTTVPNAKPAIEKESKKNAEPVKETPVNTIENVKQSVKTAEAAPSSEPSKKSTDSSSVLESTFSPNLRSSQTLHSSRPASIATTRSASSAKYINTDVDDLRAVRAQSSKPLMQAVS